MAGNEKDLDASFLKSLEKYAQSFFCMPVEMLKVVSDLKVSFPVVHHLRCSVCNEKN